MLHGGEEEIDFLVILHSEETSHVEEFIDKVENYRLVEEDLRGET